jgi:hypothetical protein
VAHGGKGAFNGIGRPRVLFGFQPRTTSPV